LAKDRVIGYGEGDDYDECLVLGTTDIVEALARFREEHGTAPVWGAQRAELDQGDDSPMGYLDRYDEILVVGGAKLRKVPGRYSRAKPSQPSVGGPPTNALEASVHDSVWG
jgi:hypothetical protein